MADKSPTARITAQSTLKPALKAWESYMIDQGRSMHTVKAFLSDLKILDSYLAPDRTLGSITTNDLNKYFTWMEKERDVPCAPKTLARRITSLKTFFLWLHKYGVLVIDPAEKVANRSVLSPLPQVLTSKETEAVLLTADRFRRKAKPDARYYALLALLLSTGIKKSECVSIHLNHIDLNAPGGPTVFIRYASPTNRYKERKLTLSDEWIPAYQEYVQQYNPADQLFPWSPRRLEYLLEDIGREAGLEKHLSFDMCRWTCALNDYKLGIDAEKIRQKIGVSKIQWRELNMKLRQLAGAK